MLTSLIYVLLFETIQPSYGTFVSMTEPHALVSLADNPNQTPQKKNASIGPVIEAQSVYALDITTNTSLFVRDIFSRRKVASIEKLVTAMVILDYHKLDEKVVVSKNAAFQVGSQMGLRTGEELTVESLLTGMLINSGNDAAVALAEYDAGSEASFVEKLNAKAIELNLRDTHFANAKGFDEDDNYSTAFDTMLFSRAALKYPFIRKTASIKMTEVTSASGKTKHKLENTNELLDNAYVTVVGLKTGTTPASGQSFVSLAKGPKNHEILTVMLDSPHRFKETTILLDWVFRNYEF